MWCFSLLKPDFFNINVLVCINTYLICIMNIIFSRAKWAYQLYSVWGLWKDISSQSCERCTRCKDLSFPMENQSFWKREEDHHWERENSWVVNMLCKLTVTVTCFVHHMHQTVACQSEYGHRQMSGWMRQSKLS